MRFTASFRKDETAKTVRPMGVPEKGPATVRTRPAVLPEGQDANGFGVHTQRRRSQPVRCRAELRGYCSGDQKVVRPRCKERLVSASRYRWSRDHQISQVPTRENPINRFTVLMRSGK